VVAFVDDVGFSMLMAALAGAFGANSHTIEDPAQGGAILDQALASGTPHRGKIALTVAADRIREMI
jgi:hypothetical protein